MPASSPISGVDHDIAEHLRLAGNSYTDRDTQTIAQQFFGGVDRGEVIHSFDDDDAAFGANAIAMTRTCDGQTGIEKGAHQVGAFLYLNWRSIFHETNDWHLLIIAQTRRMRQSHLMEKVAIIGASRGLGACLVRAIPATCEILAVARNRQRLEKLQQGAGAHVQIAAFDVTKDLESLLSQLRDFEPTRVFYLSGGGPFGEFQTKAWKDHMWAFEVTFLAAARIVHALLNESGKPPQVVLCGSSVAESKGDAKAASYASAKHALRGFYESLRLENPSLDVRLFSPGYLDTELLPKGAEVRYKGVWNPEMVAQKLWDWSLSDDHAGHLSLSPHPNL